MVLKFCEIIDDTYKCSVADGNDIEYYKSIGMVQRDVELSEVDNSWYIKEHCPHFTPEEKEKKERERLNMLNMTKLDFVKKIAKYGVTYEAIRIVLDNNYEAKMQFDLCERIYRGNELLEPLASQFGITAKQLDEMFEGV